LGFNISASILAFFYLYLRPIIEAGKLYKVYSPLYQLNDKDMPFVANKAKIIELYHKKITKTYAIRTDATTKKLSKDDFKEFLSDTYEYKTELALLAKDSGNVDKFFVETVIAFLVIIGNFETNIEPDDLDKLLDDQKFITKFMSAIQKIYPEIVLNGDTLSGTVDGTKFISLHLGHRFLRKAEFSYPIYRKYGYWLHVKETGKETEKKMSIAKFLDECAKLTPDILHRFKGLSEINPSDLHNTTMDINNRISVQYTIEDVEKELALFKITHGTSSEDAENRKKMMKAYKIKREDLDN
jgi:DNA gyrase/topoisomerase IV subunit B